MSSETVLVIGAGHNGLIAACYLARAGKKVTVLERRGIVGGACVTEEVWEGYHISTAAYLCSLLQPEIVRDLELERYGFEVYPRTTSGFLPFPDGTSLFLLPDIARMRAELQRFCKETPEDIETFFAFEYEVETVAAIIQPFLMAEPPTESELRQAFEQAGAAHLYEPYLLGSVQDLMNSRFQNTGLKAMLCTDGLIGTYGGPSTQGTAYVLLHHYLGNILGSRGSWGYVRGGMGNITQALAKSLESYGGEIRTDATVTEILLQEGKAVGVRLESGETLFADAILSNADPYITFIKLLPTGVLPEETLEPIRRLTRYGGASAKINLAVSELPQFTCLPKSEGVSPQHLGTVHICPDMDYLEQAWQYAAQGIPSQEPMIEIYLQTATDSSLTPPDKHILSLFTQYFPYNLAAGLDLDSEREAYTERVIEIVARYAPNVPNSIIHRQTLTPRDLEARFSLTGGHIFHGDLLPPNLWQNRPAPGFNGAKTPVAGLYLCGSGAHPGGCVFGAPGYNAAQAVLKTTQN